MGRRRDAWRRGRVATSASFTAITRRAGDAQVDAGSIAPRFTP